MLVLSRGRARDRYAVRAAQVHPAYAQTNHRLQILRVYERSW